MQNSDTDLRWDGRAGKPREEGNLEKKWAEFYQDMSPVFCDYASKMI